MDGFDARREDLLSDVDMVIDSDLDDSECSFLNWLIKSTETSNTDILDQDLNILHLKELKTHTIKVNNHGEKDSTRIMLKKTDESKDTEIAYYSNSTQDFIISPEKVTKPDQIKPEPQHHKIVTDRFDESSSDISMDDSLVLHK